MLAASLIILIILIFIAFIIFMIRREKVEKVRKVQMIQSLGFIPVESDQELLNQIFYLFENRWDEAQFQVQNLYRKRIPDGDMYIFDLVNIAGDEDHVTEEMAIAMVSQYLELPAFTMFPRLAEDGLGWEIANRVLGWVVSKLGDPINFPDHPEFQKNFLVSSKDVEETRQFLDDRKLHMLAQIRMIGIHAGGNMFVLSRFLQTSPPEKHDQLSKRITLAMDVFQILSS